MILNSRPLSYVSAEDIEEPLTSSHLIIGHRVLSLPNTVLHYSEDDSDDDLDLSHEALGRRMKHLNKTLDHFWKRWRLEYLIQLRECHHYDKGTNVSEKIHVGDIVLVHDEHHPRGFWKLAKVEKLIEGSDGHARGAVIRTPSKGTKTTILRCPLKFLYPLELCCKAINETENVEDAETGSKEKGQPERTLARTRPPKRAATQQAERWLKTVIDEVLDEPEQ